MISKNPVVRNLKRNQSTKLVEKVEDESEAPMMKRSE
jgi:hypothetical protein